MNKYKTSEVAKIIGIHVNTVRFYEKCELISKPDRLDNGYRVFTDLHIEQFKLARAVLKVEILQNGLRKKIIKIIKISAKGNFNKAEQLIYDYLNQIDIEIKNANEAIEISQLIINYSKNYKIDDIQEFTRKETAEYLSITVDTLRNWELNGLISIKSKKNGYKIYTLDDIQKLKIIRSLRCANYSLSSILRMLKALSYDSNANIRQVINTPNPDNNIITACDKLLISLNDAKKNALYALKQIEKIKKLKK